MKIACTVLGVALLVAAATVIGLAIRAFVAIARLWPDVDSQY